MADIKTNTNRMRGDVEGLDAQIRNMNRAYQALQQKKGELDVMWDGPASESFKNAFQDDLTALQTMIQNMQKLSAYENTAKGKYEQCENRVSEIISGI